MKLFAWLSNRSEQKKIEAARRKAEAEKQERDKIVTLAVVPLLVNRALASAQKEVGATFTGPDTQAILKIFGDLFVGPTWAVAHFVSSGRDRLLAAFLYQLVDECAKMSSIRSEIAKELTTKGTNYTEEELASAVDYVLGCGLNTVERIARKYYSAAFEPSLTRITALVGTLVPEDCGPVVQFALAQLQRNK